MTAEVKVREKIQTEKRQLVADLREAERLERSTLAGYEKESAKRHQLALKMLDYEKEEEAPEKLRLQLRTRDAQVASLSRSIDGARVRAARIREEMKKLDSPAEFERRVEVKERLDRLHQESQAKREENGTMAAAKNTTVRGLNPKSRAYKISEADQKLIEASTKNAVEARYATQCIKVKAGVRSTPPGYKTFEGMTEARAAAIEKAVGFERPVKKAKAKATGRKTKTATESKKKTAARGRKSKTSGSKKSSAAKPADGSAGPKALTEILP